MLILIAFRRAFSLRLLVLLLGLKALLALIPAVSASRLLSMHAPADGASYDALDYHLSFREQAEAWGDADRAASLFSRTGLPDIFGTFFSGGILLSLAASALLYLFLLQALWPGFLRLLSREKGFWEPVRAWAPVFLAVAAVQFLLYWGVYALFLVLWGGKLENMIESCPTEFLAILLGAVQVFAFLAVFFFLRLFFGFLKIGMVQTGLRNPFKNAWPALKLAVAHYPSAAGVFVGLFLLWAFAVWVGGLHVVTLVLRDYFWLTSWAFLIQLYSPPATNPRTPAS